MNSIKAFYDRIPKPIQWLLWCVVIFVIYALVAEIPGFRELNWLVLLGLATAVFLLVERPFLVYSINEAIETGVAALLIILFIFHLGWTYLAPTLIKEEIDAQACSPSSPEMKCYLFSRENCQAVWNQYFDDCTTQVKANLDPSRKTSLIGPTVRLCTYKKFDKSFSSTRRMEVSPECKEHFSKVDAPSL